MTAKHKQYLAKACLETHPGKLDEGMCGELRQDEAQVLICYVLGAGHLQKYSQPGVCGHRSQIPLQSLKDYINL